MPELPEITILAEQMNRELAGTSFSGVKVFQPKCLNLPPEVFTERVVGLQVEEVYHRVSAARDGLNALSKSKRLVKGWVAAELQNQAAGLGTAKDVKDAIKESFQVLAAIHRLTHDYNVGLAELKRVSGVIGEKK